MNDTNNQNLGGSVPPSNVATGGQTPPPPQTPSTPVADMSQSSPFSDEGVPPSMSPLADVQSLGSSPMPAVSSTPFQGPNMNNSNETPTPSFGAPQETPQTPLPPVTPPTPAPTSEQPPITAMPAPKRGSKFRTFIIIAIIAIVAIYSVVAFLYLQNQKLKSETEVPAETTTELPTEEEGGLPSPTVAAPTISSDNVKILNGNVVLQGSGDATPTTLIDKKDFSGTGITGFSRVALSNDSKMLCFESWPPSPEPALYVAKADGTDVKEVSPNRQNCLWSKDSTTIYYTDYLSKTSSKNVLMYDVATGKESNLTLTSQPTTSNRQFDIVGLSADGSKLVCKYTDPQDVTGNCEIDLTSLEVTIEE